MNFKMENLKGRKIKPMQTRAGDWLSSGDVAGYNIYLFVLMISPKHHGAFLKTTSGEKVWIFTTKIENPGALSVIRKVESSEDSHLQNEKLTTTYIHFTWYYTSHCIINGSNLGPEKTTFLHFGTLNCGRKENIDCFHSNGVYCCTVVMIGRIRNWN